MKQQYLAVVIAALVATTAHATNNGNGVGNGGSYMPKPVVVVKPTTSGVNNNGNRNSNSNSNTNRNNAAAGAVSATSSNQTQGQVQSTSSTSNPVLNAPASATTKDANNASQTVSTNTPRQVASAAGVAIMPTAVCSGSTGAGAQGVAFGVSFGTSWTDENCMLLEQARTVSALGMDDVAAEMLCVIPNYAEARAALGKACVRRAKAPAAVITSTEQYTDPYIRRRLGLPTLEK